MVPRRQSDPLHGYAGFLLGRAYQASRGLLDRLLVEHGLTGVTPGMGPVFYHLFEHDGCPLRDIVERTGLDKATVTNQIAAMQRAGFVRRVRSQVDRRLVLIHLTPSGHEMAGPARELLVHLEATLRAPFDTQRWQHFSADLRALIDAAESHSRF